MEVVGSTLTLCILAVFGLQVPGVLCPADHMYFVDEESTTDEIQ